MYTADDFTKALDDYIEFNKELMKDIGPMQGVLGVLGFGPKPGHDPGHAEFFNEMKSVVSEVCKETPDASTADSIMDILFGAREKYADENLSPYIFSALEGVTQELIPFISEGKAQTLYNKLKKMPAQLRTPVRKQLMKALAEKI